jgi:cyanophycinase-like exopeptidase
VTATPGPVNNPADDAVNGIVCLQGGNELTDACRPMDSRLLSLAPPGPVVVVPLASEPGTDYRRTGENADRYFTGLGADVVVAPDARHASERAAASLESAGMIVLTGGSPRRLRDALVASGLDERIRERHRTGTLVMGASAGAMVACVTTLLPQWRGHPSTGRGLGLVAGRVVVPHFDGKRGGWVQAGLSVEPVVLGIPECSGVLVAGHDMTAVGVEATTVITATGRAVLASG